MEKQAQGQEQAGTVDYLQNGRRTPGARVARGERNKASGGASWQKIRAVARLKWVQWAGVIGAMVGVQYVPVDRLISAACGKSEGCGALVSAVGLVVLLLLTLFIFFMTLRALWRQRRARIIQRAGDGRGAP